MLSPRTIQRLVLCAAGLAVALQGVTAADGKDHPKRKLDFKNHGNTKYSITAKSNEAGVKSKMHFSVSVRGFPNFRLAYFTKEEDTIDGFAFRVGILKLAEYNATVAANVSTNTYSLRGTRGQWTKPSKDVIYEEEGDKVYKLSSTMTGKGDHANMTMRFDVFLSTAALKAGNVTYHPNSIKYTLTVLDWPYTMQNSSLSFLTALFDPKGTRTWGNKTVTVGGKSEFDWDPTVLADGVEKRIERDAALIEAPISNTSASGDADDEYRKKENIVFMYHLVKDVVHPKNVTWDPSLAYDDSEDLSSGAAPERFGVPASNVLFPIIMAAMLLLS